MKIKEYFFEVLVIVLTLLGLVVLAKMSPTTAVSPTIQYVPPDVIDPKQLLDYSYVQERTEMVRRKREQRGFGMGFQLRSNFWVDNEKISLVEYAADYADTWVTLYGPGKKEPKLQIVEVMSWGSFPIVAFEAGEDDVGYLAEHSPSSLLAYPEIGSEAQFEKYCSFFKRNSGKYPEQKFGPILPYEYFSGKLDGKPRWDVIDTSCFDFIALSSYPTRMYKSMEKLPNDYYSDVVNLFPDTEIVFADVGWSTTDSSEEDQSLFLEYLYSFAKNHKNIKAVIYARLFDPFDDALYYYKGVGLISSDEIAKPALATWKRLFSFVKNK